MLKFIIISFGVMNFLSCSLPQPKQEVDSTPVSPAKPGLLIDSVIQSVHFIANPEQSFALYLPPTYSDTANFPLIIFFDPHGTGSLPLKKYKLLAEHFDFILAGSNNSKNGLSPEQTDQIAANLLNELRSRLSLDEKRITLAGFSGGAKVALSAAEENPDISSIIYSGSALPLEHPSPALSLLGFAGLNDMNYTELVSFDQSLLHNSHLLIEWDGKHEWPDSIVFTDAFYWCSFHAMQNNFIRKNDGLINEYLELNRKAMNSADDPLEAVATINKTIFFLNGLTDISGYSKQLISIQQQDSYQEAIADKGQWLEQEQSLKENYMKAFQEKDLNWWNQEITRMINVKDAKLKPMYDRLLGFISLAGYSISTSSIQQNQFDVAAKMLTIYKLADPKNPDQPFLQACLYAKENQNEKAIASLGDAIKLGLNDRNKILNEPALQPLQSSQEFQEIINEIK